MWQLDEEQIVEFIVIDAAADGQVFEPEANIGHNYICHNYIGHNFIWPQMARCSNLTQT